MHYMQIEKIMWFAITIYWIVSAVFVKKTVKRQPIQERMIYVSCVLIAFSLLFEDYFPWAFLYLPVLLQSDIWKMAGLLTCAAGLIFSLTARIYLGENWSGTITIKKDHQLIQTGPYGITRNPIYTGFLTAFAGCAITLGQLRGWLGMIFLFMAMLIKIKKEEAFMEEAFGNTFTAYKSKVKKLIPGIY